MCTLEARPAIVVEIRHAVTTAPLADSATVQVTDGPFTDTLGICGAGGSTALSRCGVWERAGVYDVQVTRPGYQQWVRAGVRVERDQCHVLTVTLQADLQPLP